MPDNCPATYYLHRLPFYSIFFIMSFLVTFADKFVDFCANSALYAKLRTKISHTIRLFEPFNTIIFAFKPHYLRLKFISRSDGNAENYYQPVISFIALPISARLLTVLTPALCNAANFSSAVPLPPEIIAPACPIRLPAGAVTPAI
jgi:hypothetical protein